MHEINFFKNQPSQPPVKIIRYLESQNAKAHSASLHISFYKNQQFHANFNLVFVQSNVSCVDFIFSAKKNQTIIAETVFNLTFIKDNQFQLHIANNNLSFDQQITIPSSYIVDLNQVFANIIAHKTTANPYLKDSFLEAQVIAILNKINLITREFTSQSTEELFSFFMQFKECLKEQEKAFEGIVQETTSQPSCNA